jgi:hypothetical protein
MTLGLAPRQADLFRTTVSYCDQRVAPDSIYGVLYRECFAPFPDEIFAGLFDEAGRRSVPPMIVAVVMVLQRLEGLSDRGGGRPFHLQRALEVCRWRAGVRLPGFRAHGAGRYARPAGPPGAPGPGHGGRRAWVRGRLKVAADFALLGAAVNLARLAVLGVAYCNGAWVAGGG